MMLLLEFAVKASILLVLALAGAALARRQSAAMRHTIVACGVAASLALPVLALVSPGWDLPAGAVGNGIAAAAQATPPIAFRPGAAPPRSSQVGDPGSVVAAILVVLPSLWLLGSLLLVCWLGTGLWKLRRLERESRAADDPEWTALIGELADRLAIRRPVRLLFSVRHELPMTWGARTPRILLPESARHWPDARKRVVLLHELAHVVRADWTTHLGAALLRVALWFNPLVWIACRRLGQESEAACDDRVLHAGIAGTDYASHLLDLARTLGRSRDRFLPAPAIVETSSLERRVRAMLNPSTSRAPLGKSARTRLLLLAAVLAISVAGGSAAQNMASFAASLADQHGGTLPGATVTLTEVPGGTTHTLRSDRDGRVEFDTLKPGTYDLVISLPGFSNATGGLELRDGQRVDGPQFKLSVGEIQETVTVTDDGTPGRRQYASGSPSLPACPGGPSTADGRRIGGNILPPRKIQNIQPDYPSQLAGSGTSGDVRLLAQIAEDGRVTEVSVVSSPQTEFSSAATAAVKEWQFTPTLLNCEPVAVRMHVFVRFAGRQ